MTPGEWLDGALVNPVVTEVSIERRQHIRFGTRVVITIECDDVIYADVQRWQTAQSAKPTMPPRDGVRRIDGSAGYKMLAEPEPRPPVVDAEFEDDE